MRAIECQSRILLLVIAIVALAVLAQGNTASAATAYPIKPVRVIVGAPPGSGTDVIMRVAAQVLAEKWAQAIVVDNRV